MLQVVDECCLLSPRLSAAVASRPLVLPEAPTTVNAAGTPTREVLVAEFIAH